MRFFRSVAFGLSLLALSVTSALAQTSPSWSQGYVPTAGQWNLLWASKQDYLGAAPCIVSGCVLTGKVTFAPSTAIGASINIPAGTPPTTPINGDIWTTTAGVFVQVNGVTIGPLASTSSGSVQTINLNSGPLIAAPAGTILQMQQANSTTARALLTSFAAASHWTCGRSDGSGSAPVAIGASAEEICSLNAYGNAAAGLVGPFAAVRMYSAQGWNAGQTGTYLRLSVTANNTSTLTDALSVENDGGITIPPTVTGASQGAGTINLSSGLFKNGTAAATTVNGVSCPLFGTCSITATASSITPGTTGVVGGSVGDFLSIASGPTLSQVASTGTGSVVLSASPTLSGTIAGTYTLGGTPTIPTSGLSGTVSASNLPTATSGAKGVVQGDGSTITLTAGVISATTATGSQLGVVKPDGSTIVISSGVLTAVGATATSITAGTTTVSGGTAGGVLTGGGGGTLASTALASLMTAGNGIAITGTTTPTITNNISAGTALTITGTNPLTINARLFCELTLTTSQTLTWSSACGFTPSEFFVEEWGGGASGAGENGGTSSSRGAGGGAGAFAWWHYSGTMDATLAVTIGAGGTSCTSSCGGVAGGTTSVVGSNFGTLSVGGGNGAGCSGGACAGGGGGVAGTSPGSGTGFFLGGGQGGAQPGLANVFGIGGNAPRGGAGGQSNVSAGGNIPGGGGAGENQTGGGSGAGARGEVHVYAR